MEVVYSHAAAIDVHKKQITVAVRVPGSQPGQRRQEIRKFSTFYPALQETTRWLVRCGVTHVAMESTGVYWRPVFHALSEVDGLNILLVNAQHVHNVPGRKTDAADAAWLAELCEIGLLRGSFIPPADIAALRELTRYRKKLIEERVRETQRLYKVLEDAGIKLDSVASNAIGVSGRLMIEALIAGERDPRVLADLAKRRLRQKIADLTLALTGRFTKHHAFLANMHLKRIDQHTEIIAEVEARIDDRSGPYQTQVGLLSSIPGIGERTSEIVISEIGVDMSRFPTAHHLAA